MSARCEIVSLGLFQVTWFACAFGAARGTALPGLLAAAVLVLWFVATSARRGNALVLLILSGCVGLAGETALLALGLLAYAAHWPVAGLAPAWIVALWIAFGATLAPFARMLGKRPMLLSIPLGLFLAPLSYLGGARIGAIAFPEPALGGLMATGVLWAMALPLLMAAHLRLGDPRT